MADLRVQVTLNGRPIATAGLDGIGYLNVLVRASRPADELGPLPDESELIVGGFDEAQGDMHWARLAPTIGDEVTIRFLGPGPADPPAEVYSPVGPDDLPF